MTQQVITIKSFNGIGDLLFATPTLRCIKEFYPDSKVIVNTNRPTLLENNPFVDVIGTKKEGVFLLYTAPDSGKLPIQHHIVSDWEIICKEYNLSTRLPTLRPELYINNLPVMRDVVGVQVHHKRHYHDKRVWPKLDELSKREGFEPIPWIDRGDKMQGLVRQMASYRAVVWPEGGVSHIAAALKMSAVVLFGGFSDPKWTGYDDHINITSEIECKHCFNLNPCKNEFKCWDGVTIERIVDYLF